MRGYDSTMHRVSPEGRATRLRREAGSKLVQAFFEGAARAARFHPRARPSVHGVEVIRDVRYGDHGAFGLLDIYRPHARSGPTKTVLYVHGGGFRILSKDTHWVMGLQFARQGYTVFSINYRLAPQHPFPAALEDCAAAYAWVQEHAASYGADPRALILAGESAGANLVTALTVCATMPRPEPYAARVYATGVVPRAVSPACGILEVSNIERFRARVIPLVYDRIQDVSLGYLGASGVQHTDLADPLVVLESDTPTERPLPPFFVPCGTQDPLLDDTRRLSRALEKRGVDVEEAHYRGTHAFHAFVFRPEAKRCWRDTHRFLQSRLGDPRDATATS